jgi:hypothetical protein
MGRTGNEGYARAQWGKLSVTDKAAIQDRLGRLAACIPGPAPRRSPARRPGQITASNFYPEIASDQAGEMQKAIQLFLRVS